MNNEFNNQNMNQFENNNMNTQYSNNDNNLNNKKSGNNVLITILVIIIIALSGVCLYLFVNNKNTDVSNNISESDALAIGNELWEYAYSTYWGSEPAWIEHLSDLPNEYGEIEIICDTKKEQVKQKYSANFEAQSCLSDGSSCIDYTVETFIPKFTCEGAGRGGLQNYKETTLTVNSIQKDKIIFTAKSEYCGSSFCQESNETVKEIKKDFIIVKQNDNWLISNFYLPN